MSGTRVTATVSLRCVSGLSLLGWLFSGVYSLRVGAGVTLFQKVLKRGGYQLDLLNELWQVE